MALATAKRSPDGRPPSDSCVRDPDVALGEQRAQHRGEVRPGRTAAEPEQRDAGRVDRGPDLRRSAARGARTTRPAAPARPSSPSSVDHPRPGRRRPTPSTSAFRRQHRGVHRVVDHHAADVIRAARRRRAPGPAAWRRGRRARARGSRADAGSGSAVMAQHLPTGRWRARSLLRRTTPDRTASSVRTSSDRQPLGRGRDRGQLVLRAARPRGRGRSARRGGRRPARTAAVMSAR